MTATTEPAAPDYDALYAAFDSPLMRQLREQAYGEDIGQHSWVTADELRADLERLSISASSRLLDLGCGPCGPLVFALRRTACTGTGLEASAAALASGQARADAAGVGKRIELLHTDLDLPLPCRSASFDAAIALDVVLHLRDRKAFFDEVARVLVTNGKFLFTDAAVVCGAISNLEVDLRSMNSYAQFAPPGFNERMLAAAGFRLVGTEDRTASVLRNAGGRLRAVLAHRAALEAAQGAQAVARQQRYLETVVAMAERGALARVMYLAERSVP